MPSNSNFDELFSNWFPSKPGLIGLNSLSCDFWSYSEISSARYVPGSFEWNPDTYLSLNTKLC